MIFKSTRCSSIIATPPAIVERMISNKNAKLNLGFSLFKLSQFFDRPEVEIHAQAARGC
jgi:hypothetical protein